jgi:Methyltransferase domain
VWPPPASEAVPLGILGEVVTYDAIGGTYPATRRPDPRIGARINAALGDARSVINVGAGGGSYEPRSTVLAVEPSPVMIRHRRRGSSPVVQARAESLPVADNAADAVTALLTVHHWTDLEAGAAELRRVARRRLVVLTWDQAVFREFWLVNEYLRDVFGYSDARAIPLDYLAALLGGARIEPVPIPHDCTDGFAAAYWRRPAAYLDPVVRAGISTLAQARDVALRPGLDRLAADLHAGRWHKRHSDLIGREEIDAGYRLLVAEQ